MKRRRSARDWYTYHLERSQQQMQATVEGAFAPVLEEAQAEVEAVRSQLTAVKRSEPLTSRVLGFFAVSTQYRTQTLVPLERKLQECESRLRSILQRRWAEIARAREEGAADYRAAHAARKQERLAQAERAAERAERRRIRYLEVSRSLRSAARALKTWLLGTKLRAEAYVTCFYCGVQITAQTSHLDHKKPISRGGTNRLKNLVLACARCNLSKGSKSHDEFVGSRRTAL